MKFLLLTSFALTTCITFAQDSVSVLFIGNSYTSVNDLPTTTSNLTISLGDKLTFDSQTIGGASFAVHAGNAITYTKIKAHPWDFVVLQGQSQELSFPTSQIDTESLPYIEQLADSVHGSNYCSQVMMYMTWGRQNGDPQWDSISTYAGMQERLTNAAVRMADSIEASVSPVGSVWKYVRTNYPSINLYNADQSHPSVAGTYLAACTFYAALFRKTPVGASFISSLNADTAAILQHAAALVVLDSLSKWNLHALSDQTIAEFAYTNNNSGVSFLNTSSHATSYHWNFGDGQSSTETNPLHTYASNGTYTVQLIALDSCDTDTLTIQVVCTSLELSPIQNNDFMLKTLNNDLYSIESKTGEIFQLSIIDANGRLIRSKSHSDSKQVIDLSQNTKGIYFIQLENSSFSKTIKIIKN